MAPVPAYDLSMDELSMALSYVSAGLITAAPPAAPVAKSAAPAKVEKPKKVRLAVQQVSVSVSSRMFVH